MALALMLTGAAAGSQEPGPSPSPAPQPDEPHPADELDAAPEPRAAVPTAAISIQAEAADDRLRSIRTSLESRDRIEDVEQELDSIAEDLISLEEDPAQRDLEYLGSRSLTDLRGRWVRLADKMQPLEAILRERLEQIDVYETDLAKMLSVWQETRDSEVVFPAALAERFDSLLSEIAEIRAMLGERQDAVLTVQDRWARMSSIIRDAIAAVDKAQREVRRMLLSPDHPPLWRPFGASERAVSLVDQVRESWRSETASLVRFFNTSRHHVFFQAAFFVVLALLITYLRNWVSRVGSLEGDESLESAALVLSRPYSAALLLTLIFTRTISPHAPTAVLELNRIVVAIPLLRFLPGLVYRQMRRPVYATVGLYLLDQLRDLTPEHSFLRRLLLLSVTGLALAGLFWLLRPGGAAVAMDRGKIWRAVLAGGRIAAVVLVGSLIANVIGTVRLAELLTETTLNAAYGAIALFAAVILLESATTVVFRTRAAQAMRVIARHGDLVRRRVNGIIRFLGVFVWVLGVLWIAGFLDAVVAGLTTALGREWTFGALQISLGNIVSFVVGILIAIKVSQLIRFVLDEDVLSRLDLARGVPQTVSMLFYYSALALGFLLALAVAGIELTRLTLLISALGVGIGFGLQTLVNNFVSGLILIFERPIKAGDVVEVGTLIGEVRRIGIRASTVRTFDGAEVIVPNGNLLANEVVNWTLSDAHRRVEIPVGVAYGTDPEKVMELLLAVGKEHPEIIGHPEPQALFKGFGDSSLNFTLRFWTSADSWVRVSSDVTVAMNAKLKEAGIVIPFPQRDLHVKSVDPSAKGSI